MDVSEIDQHIAVWQARLDALVDEMKRTKMSADDVVEAQERCRTLSTLIHLMRAYRDAVVDVDEGALRNKPKPRGG